MSTTNYINRIPTQVDEFQNYINTTDDTQKAIDPNGFTIYPLGADGKYNYSATENTKEIKNEPMYIRWNWTAPESSQWSAFRKEYNVLYQKCNPESNAIDIELKKQLEEVISRFIQFDKQNLLIQRVSDSHQTVLSHFELFKIKRDILQFETDLRTISVNYEKQEPLTKFENDFFQKYITLHNNAFKIDTRIKALITNITKLQNSFQQYWKQMPLVKDKADKATNSIYLPSPAFKSFPSEVVSFRVPSLEEAQKNMDDFNKHNMTLYQQIVDMCNYCNVLLDELTWAESLWDNDLVEYTGEPLFKEVDELQKKFFGNINYSVEVMSLDEDHQEFLGSWGDVMDEVDKAGDAWEEMIREQKLLMKVYEIFVKFMNDKFAEKPEQPETTINADDTDDNTDDLRAETIKRYQSTIENNTNIYFDVEDWHIILDHLEAKQDDKKGNIAIEAALTQHPNHPVLLTRKAKKEVDKGDYKKALELINQAEQQEEKHHPNLYYVKANIYGLLGSADLSIPLYKKLASQKGEELKWWRTHSYDCLIEIYCEQKNYPECIRLSKEAIEERTDDEILYSNLALYHALNNNPEEAEKVCNQFIKKHPDSSTCIARLGHTYVQTKQYDKAIQSFNTAYNMDNEENYGTLYYKGNVLLQLEKYEDALVCFELCLMYYKLSPDYHIAAAQCYEKLNFPKLAINHYRAALAINPDSTEALAAMKLLTNDSTPLSKYN